MIDKLEEFIKGLPKTDDNKWHQLTVCFKSNDGKLLLDEIIVKKIEDK